jgi:polyhydroxyalkanoate synthesis repressor PhaR
VQRDERTERVVLKKYGNRRLYDTRASTYVTLAEVEKLLVAGEDIEVLDAKTGEDITKEVLVQIIAERDGAKDALPLSFLKDVVRLGTGPARRQFADALSSSMGAMVDAQRQMAAEMQRAASSFGPSFMNPFSMFFRPPTHTAPPVVTTPASTQSDDVRALKAELEETKALISELVASSRTPAKLPREIAADAKVEVEMPPRKSRRSPSSSRQKRSDARSA